MSMYFVRMTPLEPFTFGGEKGFAFESGSDKDARNVVNSSYYQTSKEIPEQTTIIGMIRYIILKNAGLTKRFSEYTREDKERIAQMIGTKSFSFESEKFDMGKLKSVSPVFIVNGEKNQDKADYYIRNPLNNRGESKYESFRMSDEPVQTSHGFIKLPVDYTTKTWLHTGYLNVGNKETPKAEYIDDLFETQVYTGNRKNGDKKEDGFFKREAKRFRGKGFAFAVFAECEDGILPDKTIACMGLKKSAFMIESLPVDENDLEERIQRALGKGETWYYALSDLLLEGEMENTFSIIGKKQIRNLSTNFEETSYRSAIKRGKRQYNLIEAGSVFYEKVPEFVNENRKAAGYDCVVRLGG